MSYKKSFLLVIAFSSLAACSLSPQKHVEFNGQYWQRKSASSALYVRGPKAQHILHNDIAMCTAELNELERLGSVRDAVPADRNGNIIPPNPKTAQGRLDQWETPERDGYLYAEHFDYHDFETCMTHKGWERVDYIPYETSKRARDNYLDTIIYQGHRSEYGDNFKSSQQGDYAHLNE